VFVGCASHAGRHGLPATTATTAHHQTVSSTVAPVTVQQFSAGNGTGLSFVHPMAWRETRYSMMTSFSDLVVYLSNRPLHAPCTTTRTGGNLTTTCARPLAKLGPGGVLVSWSDIGFPSIGPFPAHPNTTIGGRRAEVEIARPGDGPCTGLGQDESITADIARPVADNYYEMVACLRGPNLARSETLVRRMLASTRVTG
jgi:hypothetical protein